jgi:hypothetical protein
MKVGTADEFSPEQTSRLHRRNLLMQAICRLCPRRFLDNASEMR